MRNQTRRHGLEKVRDVFSTGKCSNGIYRLFDFTITEFAVYKSWDDAIYDYFDLLKSGKIRNSEGAYDVMVSNKGYKKPAQALQDMGFSSDPNYASKLIAIIEENDLTTYDK